MIFKINERPRGDNISGKLVVYENLCASYKGRTLTRICPRNYLYFVVHLERYMYFHRCSAQNKSKTAIEKVLGRRGTIVHLEIYRFLKIAQERTRSYTSVWSYIG
jgi:hypothetical protein